MEYELAKKLKLAGYPQKGMDCNWLMRNEKDDEVYAPPLEELIEACKEEFVALYRYTHRMPDEMRWCAEGKETKSKRMRFEGHDPRSAVVNLWLKLNEEI